MRSNPRVRRLGVVVLGLMGLACAGSTPSGAAAPGNGLAPCPSTPNCVSSEARRASQAVAPFRLAAPPDQAWAAARRAVSDLPRTRIVEEEANRLRAESRSLLFRFVDDLELRLDRAANSIAVRSASRVGRSDLGVNRDRVEELRERLQGEGVVH